MNGFEPLRRRIIDYTVAGQWTEVYDGPLEDCASEKFKAENAKLRELVRILYYCGLPWKDCDKCAMNGAEMHVKISEVEFCDGMYDRMRELGIEIDK